MVFWNVEEKMVNTILKFQMEVIFYENNWFSVKTDKKYFEIVGASWDPAVWSGFSTLGKRGDQLHCWRVWWSLLSLFLFTFLDTVWSLKLFVLRGNTKLERGTFILSCETDRQEAILEKFAFSNALCLSGKSLQILQSFCLFVLVSAQPCVFFSSEAGHLGGGFRQLCGVNSVHSRGTVDRKKR